jgi:hypothetical protein
MVSSKPRQVPLFRNRVAHIGGFVGTLVFRNPGRLGAGHDLEARIEFHHGGGEAFSRCWRRLRKRSVDRGLRRLGIERRKTSSALRASIRILSQACRERTRRSAYAPFYGPDLGGGTLSPFARDASNKLVREANGGFGSARAHL